MKPPNLGRCTEKQLWKYVASHLAKNGIDTVLVGGAVVSIYSEGAYQSGDLDFVLLSFLNTRLPQAMAEIGFKVEGGRHFRHPECSHLFVEFVSAPVSIGDDTQIKPKKEEVDGQVIRILTPTDCIRDRLASYVHFSARECLDQAVLVGSKHSFNSKKIREWCLEEGYPEAFSEFTRLLNQEN